MDSKNYRHNVLFLSAGLLYPPNNGFTIRGYYIISELRKKGYNVTLLCFTNNESNEMAEELEKSLKIKVLTIGINKKMGFSLSHIFLTIFSRHPYQIAYYNNIEFNSKLIDFLNNNRIDLLYIYGASMSMHGLNIGVPKILDTIDCLSQNTYLNYKSSKNIINKIYFYLNHLKWINVERKVFGKYDYVLISADRDKNALMNINNSINVVTIPNGIDSHYFSPLNLDKIPRSMVFIGSMSKEAIHNREGIIYFIEKIYPTIKEKVPDAKVFLIGKDPPANIISKRNVLDINCLGYLDDIRAYLDKCELFICPLIAATGIQNKMLVAMAMNKPIISTKFGAGDILKFAKEGEDIVIADNSEEFASKIIQLLSNQDILEKIGKNGNAIVCKNYSWESVGDKIDQIIKDLIKC